MGCCFLEAIATGQQFSGKARPSPFAVSFSILMYFLSQDLKKIS